MCVCIGMRTISRANLLSLDALDRIPVGNSDGLSKNGQDDHEEDDEGRKKNDQPREVDAIIEILQVIVHCLHTKRDSQHDGHKRQEDETSRKLPNRFAHRSTHNLTDGN